MTLNEAFIIIFATLSLALIFSRQLHVLIVRIQTLNERSTGVRVYNCRTFRDIETMENFQVWQGVKGFRLAIISLLLKI